MFQWLSLTRMSVAPASSAPSIAALVSPIMSAADAGYRMSFGFVGSGRWTPAMPSMSTLM